MSDPTMQNPFDDEVRDPFEDDDSLRNPWAEEDDPPATGVGPEYVIGCLPKPKTRRVTPKEK